ncbi:MAG: TetR/AcrR family transcriptional regulator [Deltaproteobacteria bacterium]|nr:TetR/AcrR family transcriptional regulator [Deltaproteobacteria bacterium]
MRRQQIMDAAKKVFAAKGFGGATIESIAEEAEFSPATLYLYFNSKDDLFASLNLIMLQHLTRKMEYVRDKALSPEKKIDELARALYEVYLLDPLNVVNVLRYQSKERLQKLSPELSSQISDYTRKCMNTLAEIFEKGARNGDLLDRNPAAFADIVWSLFSGLVLWEDTKRGFGSGKDLLQPTLELALEVINRGIKKTDAH